MFTIPNFLSFLRVPLALLFLQDVPAFRSLAICMAMISDCLDGYLARRFGTKSYFGTILDPLADKFFALFVLSVLIMEGRLATWELIAMLSRDIALIIFGVYLLCKQRWSSYTLHAIWSGKVSTALQFIVLFGLTLGIAIPLFFFLVFILLGIAAFIELILTPIHCKE